MPLSARRTVYKKRELIYQPPFSLLEFTLSCCLRLFLFLYAGLFVTFSFAKLGLDTGSLALTLKAAERAVKRLILFYSDFCHYLFPSPRFMRCEAPDCTSLILYPSQTRLSRIISRFFEKNVSEMYYLATIFTILPGT